MARTELAEAARRASKELGVPVITQSRILIEGLYVQRVDLAQGRMAIILQQRPNGELSRSEATTLLEYAYVATGRILACVEGSPIPGVPDMMLIRFEDEPT